MTYPARRDLPQPKLGFCGAWCHRCRDTIVIDIRSFPLLIAPDKTTFYYYQGTQYFTLMPIFVLPGQSLRVKAKSWFAEIDKFYDRSRDSQIAAQELNAET